MVLKLSLLQRPEDVVAGWSVGCVLRCGIIVLQMITDVVDAQALKEGCNTTGGRKQCQHTTEIKNKQSKIKA